MTSGESSDQALLAETDVQTYRASGPGGQNRNKVETAVRLHHRPSGVTVTATESRSQATNRVRALQRLRRALALRIRRPVELETIPVALTAVISRDGRLVVGQRDGRYLPAGGAVLDILAALQGNLGETAGCIGVSTGNLSR